MDIKNNKKNSVFALLDYLSKGARSAEPNICLQEALSFLYYYRLLSK